MLDDFLNMSNVFSNIFGVGLVGGVTLAVKFVVNYVKKSKSETQAMKEAIKSLLHNELFIMCNHHLNNGSITTSDFNNLHHLYVAYLSLGGNGSLVDLMEHVKQLEIGGE